MNNRALLTAGAALLAAAAAALAIPGMAGATAAPVPAAVSAASFMSGPGNASIVAMAGVLAARGTSPASIAAAEAAGRGALAAAPAAGCKEPDCNMTYHGGRVQHTPHVYLLFWGSQWNNAHSAKMQSAKRYVNAFFKGLGKAPDVWTQTLSQYHDKSGQPVFGRGILAGVHTDTSALPRSISPTQLGNEAAKGIGIFRIRDVRDAEVVIMAQSGACFAPQAGITFAGNCGTPQNNPGYCGYHSADINNANPSLYLPWTNLPFQPDAGSGCDGQGVGGIVNPSINAGFSVTGGHEVAETITDPLPALPGVAWIDLNDLKSGGEIGDKCAWAGAPFGDNDPFGYIKLSTGKFLMQSLWSNAASRHCVMSGKLLLRVTTPPTQTTAVGHSVSLQIHATLSGRAPLRYGSAGLPKGLVISKTTGKITGKPTVKGIYHVKVGVSYYAGSRTISFTWKIT